MSNLIPIQRLDKNGVLVTRHVRADKVQKSDAVLPKVSPVPKETPVTDRKLEKRIRKMDAPLPRTFRRSFLNINATITLAPYFSDSYSMSCSDKDIYSLLERMPLSDAIVLLGFPIKPHEVTDYTSSLVTPMDNSELVQELLTRGINANEYIKVALDKELSSDTPHSAVVDAAECRCLYPEKAYDDYTSPSRTYSSYLIQGQINLSDLKEIGVDQCSDTVNFRRVLLKLKKGESYCTASEIRGMLERTSSQDSNPNYTVADKLAVVGARANIAVALGTEIATNANNPVMIKSAIDYSYENGLDEDEMRDFCLYTNDVEPGPYMGVSQRYGMMPSLNRLWEAGVPAEMASTGMKDGIRVEQIIAIHKEDITPSVSGGWL